MALFCPSVLPLLLSTILCFPTPAFANENTSNAGLNGKDGSSALDIFLLLILVVMFVCSIRLSPKCRRRTRKLPHQIRLEKRNQQKQESFSLKPSQSFLKQLKNMQLQNTEEAYMRIDDDDDDDEDVNYFENDKYYTPDPIMSSASNFIQHSETLLSDLNERISSSLDPYRPAHSRFMHGMLSINMNTECIDNSSHNCSRNSHSRTQHGSDDDYESL
mmetsp:Transcript_46149/g.76782  ORF Transcript_46149/g.76782 Transcript_46149/m.76782 type:complete len:217 (-) Transcript_46149:143-793(-)